MMLRIIAQNVKEPSSNIFSFRTVELDAVELD